MRTDDDLGTTAEWYLTVRCANLTCARLIAFQKFVDQVTIRTYGLRSPASRRSFVHIARSRLASATAKGEVAIKDHHQRDAWNKRLNEKKKRVKLLADKPDRKAGSRHDYTRLGTTVALTSEQAAFKGCRSVARVVALAMPSAPRDRPDPTRPGRAALLIS